MSQRSNLYGQTVVTYARQSIEEASRYSLDGQREKEEHFCKQHGCVILAHFQDDGVSGATFNRPGWRDLERFVKVNRPDIVLSVREFNRTPGNIFNITKSRVSGAKIRIYGIH